MVKKLITISAILISVLVLGYSVYAATKIMTAVGTAQVDTAQKEFGTGSGLFDGNSDYLTTASSSDYAFGTGDFTIDMWVRFNNLTNTYQIWVGNGGGATWSFYRTNVSGDTDSFKFYTGSADLGNADLSWATNTWYHVEIDRSGNSWYFFRDGVQAGTTITNSGSVAIGSVLQVGASSGDANYFNGWIDELRITKGVARHTANFTPPTSAYCYSADSQTVLLLHMDGADGSTTFTDDSMTNCSAPPAGGILRCLRGIGKTRGCSR